MNMKAYTLRRNSLCLCGSGKKFKHCCADTLSTDIKDKYFQLFQAKQYPQALIAYRTFLTQYVIWYNQHTVPFVQDSPLEADSLLCIDIDAVVETVHGIACCLYKLGRYFEIDPFLRRVSDIIRDERYAFCILGERAVWFLIQGNDNKMKQTLSPAKYINIARIATTYYGRLHLHFFLELLWFKIPLAKNLEILEVILSNVDDPFRELYQLARKAVIFFAYLDRESATSVIEEAISKFQQLKVTNGNNQQILIVGALLYKEQGMICEDQSAMLKACDIYEELIVLSDECEYLSAINHSMGQLYVNLGDNLRANQHFRTSYDLSPTPHDELVIDLAKSYAVLRDTKKAQKYLETVDHNRIEDVLKIEYYTVSTQIAIHDKDRDLADHILQQISELNVTVPIFREFITNNRYALMEMIVGGKNSMSILQRFRESISKYLILQPNFFGMGLNLNELIAPKKRKRNG